MHNREVWMSDIVKAILCGPVAILATMLVILVFHPKVRRR